MQPDYVSQESDIIKCFENHDNICECWIYDNKSKEISRFISEDNVALKLSGKKLLSVCMIESKKKVVSKKILDQVLDWIYNANKEEIVLIFDKMNTKFRKISKTISPNMNMIRFLCL